MSIIIPIFFIHCFFKLIMNATVMNTILLPVMINRGKAKKQEMKFKTEHPPTRH